MKNLNGKLFFIGFIVMLVAYIAFYFNAFKANTAIVTERMAVLNAQKITQQNLVKVGSTFMIATDGVTEILPEEADFMNKYNVFGVILMQGNVKNENQVKSLIKDIRSKVNHRIFIAVDEEGGVVSRLKWDKYSNVSAHDIGAKNDTDYAYKVAFERGQYLKSLGFDIDFAPVADIAFDASSFMYDRSYGNTPDKVKTMLVATLKGYKDSKIIAVPKHFPGHGRTTADSHVEFPMLDITIGELTKSEFVPFQAAIDVNVEMIMTGHIIVPSINDDPASISLEHYKILQSLGFKGLPITDDLKMTGKIPGGISYGINLAIEPLENVEKRMMRIAVPSDETLEKINQLGKSHPL